MSQKLTLQINSLEALERLIGGDSELEVGIRNSVVQDFTRLHLKALAGEITTDEVLRVIRIEVRQYLLENPGSYRAVVKAEIRDDVGKQIKAILPGIINDLVKESLGNQASRVKTEVSQALEDASTEVAQALKKKVSEGVLTQMVKTKLEALLR